ncbi:cytochrome c3 family protein [Lichenicola sp.]|uniref:cytochrome c3 family protein n=1 Tax=Lichenicola sp. TaxID=2804529 RepID=UPI003AFFDEB1
MRQLFAPGADAILRLVLLIVAVLVVGGVLVAGGVSRSSYMYGVGVAPSQPVPFSHKHHVAELGLDCRYCHTSVETAATAGIPPTWTCMTCHSQIWTGSSMLAPVRESLANDRPLHWVRVNRLPDYVYFNHSIHVTKGIGCSSCHGAMNTMQLTYRANAFTMQFCLNCHRNPAQFIRTPDQVWNMEWSSPLDQAKLGRLLVLKNHIRPAAQLTDCSICHR